jgi:hypothetical protein
VVNKEALGYFEDSRYEYCRINAYPPFIEYHVLTEHQSFLMVDLDGRLWRREGSKRETLLEKALI